MGKGFLLMLIYACMLQCTAFFLLWTKQKVQMFPIASILVWFLLLMFQTTHQILVYLPNRSGLMLLMKLVNCALLSPIMAAAWPPTNSTRCSGETHTTIYIYTESWNYSLINLFLVFLNVLFFICMTCVNSAHRNPLTVKNADVSNTYFLLCSLNESFDACLITWITRILASSIMFSFGFTEKGSGKASQQAIGVYGNGFKSGSMRLGRDALIFTKNGGCQTVGMLSQTYLENIKAQAVIVPIVPFNQQTNILYRRVGHWGHVCVGVTTEASRPQSWLLMNWNKIRWSGLKAVRTGN